jgi:succinoglycan biosynthesis protein ExoM
MSGSEQGAKRTSSGNEGPSSPPREDSPGTKSHIGVCLCTYKRPHLLGPLLEKLEGQRNEGLFRVSLHVVDNDPSMSAQAPVAAFAQRSRVPVTYDHEPVPNIALARNRAVRAAEGNLIAFLDDDELPVEDWLLRLYTTWRGSTAAGVLGPVRPLFPPEAPVWLVKSRLCDRPAHETGTVLTYMQTRTGNVLFDRGIIGAGDAPFPPERGRTGGEDIAFFRTMMAGGHTFIWCEEAPVYEIVLPERSTRAYYIQKNVRLGGLTGGILKELGPRKWTILLRSALAAAGHGVLSIAGLLIGPHVFMRHYTQTVYHLARIAGGLGFVPVRERQDF